METFQSSLSRSVSDALSRAGFGAAGEVTVATDPRFGDYQTNAALILGKQRGENPRAVAQKILDLCDEWDLCDRPTIAGAGFINFTLRPEAIAGKTLALLRDPRLGVTPAKSPRHIVIDLGSPN